MTTKPPVKVDDIKNEAEAIKCSVERALYYINEFLAGPMCGRCFPCSMGSYEARVLLNNLIDGKGSDKDIDRIKKIAQEMSIASLCKKGKDTAKYLLEWLDTDIFSKHVEGICPEKTCKTMISYKIDTDKCTMCGDCLKACQYGSIRGEKAMPFKSGYYPFEIKQHICVRCGECIKVCTAEAIIIVDAKIPEPVEV